MEYNNIHMVDDLILSYAIYTSPKGRITYYYSPESKEQIVQAIKQGVYKSPKELDGKLYIHSQVIYTWLRGKIKLERYTTQVKGCKRLPCRVYSVSFKAQVVEYYRTHNISYDAVAKKFGVRSGVSVSSWHSQYKEGLLTVDNTIAVSHNPTEVIRTKEEQKRFKQFFKYSEYVQKIKKFCHW